MVCSSFEILRHRKGGTTRVNFLTQGRLTLACRCFPDRSKEKTDALEWHPEHDENKRGVLHAIKSDHEQQGPLKPMQALDLTMKDRADFLGAQGDHGIDICSVDCFNGLGAISANINANFPHSGNGQWMDKPAGLEPALRKSY